MQQRSKEITWRCYCNKCVWNACTASERTRWWTLRLFGSWRSHETSETTELKKETEHYIFKYRVARRWIQMNAHCALSARWVRRFHFWKNHDVWATEERLSARASELLGWPWPEEPMLALVKTFTRLLFKCCSVSIPLNSNGKLWPGI